MTAPTERVVELVLRLVDALGTHLARIASSHDLTTMQTKVLWNLDQPCPMRVVAEALHCDASNVTGIIDRLEARGLVERRPTPGDRRVKQVVRTPAGDALTQVLRAEAYADVPMLRRLDPDEWATFTGLLERLVPDAVPVGPPAR